MSHSFVPHSSDVVWELKPKKKSRWKTLSTKETELLENSFKEYIESGPIDNGIVDLENNYQVRAHCLGLNCRWFSDWKETLSTSPFVVCYCYPGVLYSQWHGHENAAAYQCSPQETLPAWGEGGVQCLTTSERLPHPNPPHSGERGQTRKKNSVYEASAVRIH